MTRTFISPPASPMLWPALLALWALAACSDPPVVVGTPDAGTNHCAPGLKPMGPACVPIFDTCQADEVPMLGGGCKRVGVRECPGKWSLAGPPLWQCKPIGPPRTCNPGWQNVQGGWCEPILPKVACGAGTMEVIGHAACQPIGDCGSGTWGKIKATANTIFVDQAYRGSGNGSQSRPYATITAALTTLCRRHVAVPLVSWSVLVWALAALTNCVTFLALGIDVPFLAALLLLAALHLGVAVPSSPGRVGVFHYICILSLSLFSVDRSVALSYGLVLHLVVFVPMMSLGTWFLWKENYELSKSKAEAKLAAGEATDP